MALMRTARFFNVTSRGIFTSSRLNVLGGPEDMVQPQKLATGLAKKEDLAIQAGNEDPFNTNVIKRGQGTRDKPTLIPSAFESRIMGCICEEDSIDIKWMWLHKGESKRCMCGHWYQLVYKEPID